MGKSLGAKKLENAGDFLGKIYFSSNKHFWGPDFQILVIFYILFAEMFNPLTRGIGQYSPSEV